MELNILFRSMRELQGIKQSAIAKSIGKSHSSISKYESGVTTLSEDTLRRMAPLVGINEQFITESSQNPFDNSRVIKFFIPETLGIFASDYRTPFSLIMEYSKEVEVKYLVPRFELLKRIFKAPTAGGNPSYAIAVRDQYENYFILRRKSKSAYIPYESDVMIKVSTLGKEKGCQVYQESTQLNKDIFDIIYSWKEIKKTDIESFFGPDIIGLLTDKEKKLIKLLRDKKADPENLIKSLMK